MKFANQLTKTK